MNTKKTSIPLKNTDEDVKIEPTSHQIVENLQVYDHQSKALKLALLAIFTALGPVLSISFVYFPYFELMTLTIFLGGIVLGHIYGSVLAILSTTLFEVIISAIVGLGLPIYPFKIVAFLIIVNCGAFIKSFLVRKTTITWRILIATLGGLLTILYDILTTIGLVILLDMPITSYWILVLTGLPITAMRMTTNTILFAFVPELFERAIRPLIYGKQNYKIVSKQNENTEQIPFKKRI